MIEEATTYRFHYLFVCKPSSHKYLQEWIDAYKEGSLLIIDVDKNKFAEKEEDLGEIIIKVDAQLYGLF
jgi:hypothetical protein